MIEEQIARHADDADDLMVLIDDGALVAWLRDGRVISARSNPLDAPTLIEIPRMVLPVELAARLAEVTYLQAIRDTAATIATFFLRDLSADSAREYALQSLEILLAAEAVTADNVAACAADLDSWYLLAFGRPANSTLSYLEEPEMDPVTQYRNALSMLILALKYPL